MPIHHSHSLLGRQWVTGLAVAFLVALSFAMPANDLSAQTAAKWLALGDAAYTEGEYAKAIDYYDWAERKSGDWKASLGIANCWRAQMNYAKARPYYEKIADQPGIPAEAYFYLGQTLMATGDYAAAEQRFAQYAAAAPQDPRAATFRDIDKLVAAVMCDSAQYALQYLPINGKWSDFSPAFYEDGILFVSARPNEVGVVHSSTLDDAPLLDLFFAAPDTQGRWSRPKPFALLNSKLNEGPLVVDSARGAIYVTRNDPFHRQNRDKQARSGMNRLQIDAVFTAEGQAKAGAALPFNNSRFAVGHPALSPDGKQLYFASDMPGGFGGTDLYVATWQGDNWGSPQNLGSMVNTSEDELFPFIDSESQLYFASNGHLGLGGLDIFLTQRKSQGGWARVQNLGYPLNSEADDFGLILSADGKQGYLSSNRKADPKDDNIYAFKRFWPRFECNPQMRNNYCFLFWETGVIDADSMPLAYEWDFGDGFKARGLRARHCFDGPGDYTVALNLIDTVSGFIFLNQSEKLLQVRDTEQVFIDAPDRVGAGEPFLISAEKSIFQGCTIEKYYWELGNGKRETAPQFMQSYDLPGTYEIRLGVTGTPNENGDLVCKTCVTKTIEVMPVALIERFRDSVAADRAEQLASQAQWERPTLVQDLLQAGEKQFDMRDSAHVGKYSVKVHESKEPIDANSAEFKGLRDLRAVRTEEGFELHSGLRDSIRDIAPYFYDAHKAGFDDAIVVVVSDTALSEKVLRIPAKKTKVGYTLFSAEVRDANGNPLQADITFEELENGVEVVQTQGDAQGNVELRLPNGKVYIWNIDSKDHFPASGMLDLRGLSEAPDSPTRLRHKVTLSGIVELMESGAPIRINNIFFDFDAARLRPESRRQLDRLATLLLQYPEFGVVVMAHTDSWGEDAYNMELSRRRAYEVLQYMNKKGFTTVQLRSEGHGERQPAAPNDTAENRQFNRRVEFRFFPVTPQAQ